MRHPVRVLPPAVAERIAAGEVIERPASVIKELIENSLDAGATEIQVRLEDGGKQLIEVTDNGHGIPRDELLVALERHATSKLTELGDLEKLQTLGFRGEALPSIAAVADLNLLSRAQGEPTAYEVTLHNGGIGQNPGIKPAAATFGHFLSSPHGTRIQARGLFAHVPARLKFLKAQAAEVAQVREWIERLALAHPAVGFRLISGDRQILSLRPQAEAERVALILGDGEDYPIVTASNDLGLDSVLHVRVHWLQGLSTPQTRKLVQVVNGRALRDRLLQQAILTAFRQSLLPGQFPAVAVYLQVDPSELDVNVHPTKTEIRFLNSRKVFGAIESLIRDMIAKKGAPAFAPGPAGAFGSGLAEASQSAPAPLGQAMAAWGASEAATGRLPSSAADMHGGWTRPVQTAWVPSAFQPRLETPTLDLAPNAAGEVPAERLPEPVRVHPLSGSRYAGSLFNTYLLFELGDELALVDQHAADERVRFEELRRSLARQRAQAPGTGAMAGLSQALLIPEAVHFEESQRPRVESRLGWLDELGFDAEIFGEGSLLFRAVPAAWGTHNLRLRLKGLTERLIEIEDDEPKATHYLDEALFEKLASEACHSAIRAGDRLERIEAEALVKNLFECEHPWNCPHGRPTVVRVPRARFEEWFQRRADL